MLKIFRQFAFLLIFLSPLHAEFSYQSLKHENGVKIRVGEWHSKVSADPKKLLIICPGRASFIEKNDRLANYFANLGFRVIPDSTGFYSTNTPGSGTNRKRLSTFGVAFYCACCCPTSILFFGVIN